MRIKAIYIILLSVLAFNSNAQTTANLLKAGFLEKFARFSEWPQQGMGDSFDIYVIGESPFDNELEQLYHNVLIKELPVKIHYTSSVIEIQSCEILFICASEKPSLNRILEQVKNTATLTISDTKNFGKQGVIINFYTTLQNTMHFEINTHALSQSALKIEPMLLDFAKIIN